MNFKKYIKYTNFARNFRSLDSLIQSSGQNLLILLYHSISEKPLPHIAPLYRHRTVREFREDLAFLLKYFKPLHPLELKKIQSGEKRLRQPHFLITFDDGLKEVYTNVAPVMKELGLTGLVFLNPDFVDNQDLMFRYKAALIYNKNRDANILKLKHSDLNIIDKKAIELGLDFKDFIKKEKPYMSSEEIQELMDKDIFIPGAHSMDHPLYSDLNEQEQILQTTNSIQWVKNKFHPPVRTFAFPFTDDGISNSFFKNIKQDTDFTFGCAGLKMREQEGRHLQRFSLEGSEASAADQIYNEYFYYNLKSFIGKNKIKRN